MSDDLFGAGVLEAEAIACRHCDKVIHKTRGKLVGKGWAHTDTGAETCGPWPPPQGVIAAISGQLPFAEPPES